MKRTTSLALLLIFNAGSIACGDVDTATTPDGRADWDATIVQLLRDGGLEDQKQAPDSDGPAPDGGLPTDGPALDAGGSDATSIDQSDPPADFGVGKWDILVASFTSGGALTATGGRDGFLASFTGGGNDQWAASSGGAAADSTTKLAAFGGGDLPRRNPRRRLLYRQAHALALCREAFDPGGRVGRGAPPLRGCYS